MAERINIDPAVCKLNMLVQELGIASCKGECRVTPDNPKPACVYNAFDGVTVRRFKGEYRRPPEKDILTQIGDVRFTIFSKNPARNNSR